MTRTPNPFFIPGESRVGQRSDLPGHQKTILVESRMELPFTSLDGHIVGDPNMLRSVHHQSHAPEPSRRPSPFSWPRGRTTEAPERSGDRWLYVDGCKVKLEEEHPAQLEGWMLMWRTNPQPCGSFT